MSIINDLVQMGLSKHKTKAEISVKYIHIFYEGELTEIELLTLFNNAFLNYKSTLSFFEISPIPPATTSYAKIKEILDIEYYYDEEGRKRYILPDDYILFVRDFDVFYNVHKDYSKMNINRIDSETKNFKEFLLEIETYYSVFSKYFYVVPSFPSIEYAIALGIDKNLSDINATNTIDKEKIFKWFDKRLGKRISRDRKSFKKHFYDKKIFDINSLYVNAKEDRKVKKLPIGVEELKKYLINDDLEDLLKENRPFTYLDCIFEIIQDIIKNL